MAQLLSGKPVAEALTAHLFAQTENLKSKGITPTLAIIRCGEKSADLAYERGAMKRAEAIGIAVKNIVLPENVSKEELIENIEALNRDNGVHGVLLFRPLPKPIRPYETEICNHLDARKDVDSMTHLSNAGVYEGKNMGFPPCTAEACIRILDHYNIDVTGKNVVIIGRSLVIGKPLAMMLMGRNATITVCHRKTRDTAGICTKADILVSAAGELGMVTKDFVRPGQIVIDVSVNWDPTKKDGKGGTAGDAVFEEVEPIVDAITPVPGGVGAVTSVILMEHVVKAASI